MRIKHYDSCNADYPEKPEGEVPQHVIHEDHGQGMETWMCADCGAMMTRVHDEYSGRIEEGDPLEGRLPPPAWMDTIRDAYEQVAPLDEEMRLLMTRAPTFKHETHWPHMDEMRERYGKSPTGRFLTQDGTLGFRLPMLPPGDEIRMVDLDYGPLEARVLAMSPLLGEPYKPSTDPQPANPYSAFADKMLRKIADALHVPFRLLSEDYSATAQAVLAYDRAVTNAMLFVYIDDRKISKRRKRRLRGRAKAQRRSQSHVPAYDYDR